MIFSPLAADIGRTEILQRSGRRRRRTQNLWWQARAGPRRLDRPRGCARGSLATRIPGPRRLTGISASSYI